MANARVGGRIASTKALERMKKRTNMFIVQNDRGQISMVTSNPRIAMRELKKLPSGSIEAWFLRKKDYEIWMRKLDGRRTMWWSESEK